MFKPKTIEYKSDIGTFHMLAGTPFRVNLVSSSLDAAIRDSSMAQSFIILEGYMYEFTPDGDSDLADYIEQRASLSLKERFELFGLMVSFDRNDLFWDAYNATRDNAHQELPDEDEVEAKKNGSKQSSKKPSKAKSTAES